MRNCFAVLIAVGLWLNLAATLLGGEYKLEDGSTIHGEVSGFDDNGVMFRLDTGGFSQRFAWGKFTQDSLKDLAENPKVRPMVEPFIEVPPDSKPKPKPPVLKDVPRVDRPAGKSTLFSSAMTPIGLALLGLLYFANLFAGYEIAFYRNRPVALVCGLSALLPVLGPLIFLASPTLVEHAAPDTATPPPPPPPGPAVVGAGRPAGATSRRVAPPAPAGGGLRVAQSHQAAASPVEAKVYNRGDYMFNRRFIETQFSGFFRVVPIEAEKDLVMVVKTPKTEYLGKRVSRISANEMFLQLVQGGKEVSIPFGEIAQIIVRHKDDQPD